MLLHAGRGAAAMRQPSMARTAPKAASVPVPGARAGGRTSRASSGAAGPSSASSSSTTPTTSRASSSLGSALPTSRPPARASTTAARAGAGGFLGGLFKQDPSENTRRKYQERVERVNALEPAMAALDDAGLRAKTAELRKRASSGGESLDALLPEAFAVSVQAS